MPCAPHLRLPLLTIVLAVSPGLPQRGLAQQSVPAETVAPLAVAPESANPVDALLATLEANLNSYLHTVPSFLCKERIVSEMEPSSAPGGSQRTVTDSVFRVRRTLDPIGSSSLEESHAVQLIDGKPAPANATEDTAQAIAPMAVMGIYSNALNLVALSGKECFKYKVHAARADHPNDRIVVDFEDLPAAHRSSDCPTNGRISGRATIEQQSLRILRIETRMDDHINLDGAKERWNWSVDYAPVVLSSTTFWMPSAIHSKAVPKSLPADPYPAANASRHGSAVLGSLGRRSLTYTLDAHYTDYHLLNVTSRVLPQAEADKVVPSLPIVTPAPTSQP